MLVMDVSPHVVFSLPSLVFGEIFKVFCNLPNLSRQESCSGSNHIPGETYDENAFIPQKMVSLCTKFIITPLPWIRREVLPLKRRRGSDASEQTDLLVSKR